MKHFKIILITLIFSTFLGIMNFSCLPPCHDWSFDYVGLRLDQIKYESGSIVSPDDIVDTCCLSWNQYGIRCSLINKFYTYTDNNQLFIKNCYAYDCFSEGHLQNKIREIKVTTLTDYDSVHVKNSNALDLFNGRYYDSRILPIDTVILYLNSDTRREGDHTLFDLILTKPPPDDCEVKFCIVIETANNKFSDTTDILKIIK